MQECTHESNLVNKEKLSKIEEGIVDRQLDYFKCRDKITNEIQMNIVNAITSLTNVMRKILKGDKGKDLLFPKLNFDAHNTEHVQYVFGMYKVL
jgi:hypothetical protein